MNGVYLKLAIYSYLHGLQCDNFTMLAVCTPFSSVETAAWISNHDYIIIFYNHQQQQQY